MTVVTGRSRGIGAATARLGMIADCNALGGVPTQLAAMAFSLPLRRAGTADEGAQAILLLASIDVSYSTGAILDVSGARAILP
ncbi:hypothetical protein LQ948_12715 [Jiella sp. MQZ9-1]|nr:hypothetical protein [Jiella flava]